MSQGSDAKKSIEEKNPGIYVAWLALFFRVCRVFRGAGFSGDWVESEARVGRSAFPVPDSLLREGGLNVFFRFRFSTQNVGKRAQQRTSLYRMATDALRRSSHAPQHADLSVI